VDFVIFASWLDLSFWASVGMVALGLGLVIFVHELGHFVVAKACNVKCEKFYVGFDVPMKLGWGKYAIPLPRTIGKPWKWGETEYGIGIIPLGGYVKMLGQDDNPSVAAQQKERERARKAKAAEQGEVADAANGDAAPPAERHEHSDAAEALAPLEPADHDAEGLDPRSYPAKSVPQRMAIILAGVTFNVISAIIFATIAYRMGVKYTPVVVGSTIPASPSWGVLDPGEKTVQIGKHGKRTEHLRYVKDLREAIAFSQAGEPMTLVQKTPDGKIVEREVTPRRLYLPDKSPFPAIGMQPMAAPILAPKNPVLAGAPASRAEPSFEPRDRVVRLAVKGGGEAVEIGPLEYYKLKNFLYQHAGKDVVFTVERGSGDSGTPQQIDITVSHQPMRTLGLIMPMLGIEAIKPDSPADQAGLKTGDVIKRVSVPAESGEPVVYDPVDPLRLPAIARAAAGRPITLTVGRPTKKDGAETTETKEMVVTPLESAPPESTPVFENEPIAAEALGIAYRVGNRVVKVNDPKPQAGVEPDKQIKDGDQIVAVDFIAPEGKEDEHKKHAPDKPIVLDEAHASWPLVNLSHLQRVLPGAKVKVTFRREGKNTSQEITLTPVEATDWPNPQRGISFQLLSETHTAETWGEAWGLGWRETKESLLKVFTFLRKLFSGAVSPTMLGGPGTIAAVGYAEATQGWPRLLIFLTLLSANLAIVNLLPIPVLDGGHFLFLLYEGIRGKPADERWQMGLTLIGFAFILSLMLFVIGLDVYRLSGLGG